VDPLVTIGIPTYNRLRLLQEAVASALAQTYPQVEIVISQNPFRDERVTREIAGWCHMMAMRHPQVRYRRNPRNVGSPANFNAIADAARGEYLAFIGDDDRLLPDFVTRLMAAMRPDVDVVFCDLHWIDECGTRLPRLTRRWMERCGRASLAPGDVDPQIAAWGPSVNFLACLLRTEAFRRIRFREDIGNHDCVFTIQLAQAGRPFVYVKEFLCEHRSHEQTTTRAGLGEGSMMPILEPMIVPPVVEPLKRRLLGPVTVDAVTRSLLAGNREQAARYIASPYYPRLGAKAALQRLCVSLPGMLGPAAYGRIYRIAKWRTRGKDGAINEYSFLPDPL
jgi:GT2 family glycosyltransferase